MSRAISLAKIVLWMIAVYTISSVLLSLLWVYVVEAEKTEPTHIVYISQLLEREISHGLLAGVFTGLAMALYAAVDRWTIRRLARFRVALLAVAAIVSLLYIGGSFHIAYVQLFGASLIEAIAIVAKHPTEIAEPTTAVMIFGTIAKYVAVGFTTLYVAGNYWREVTVQKVKPDEQNADLDS